MTDQFLVRQPSLENHWRSVILFGRNVASYKFALGKSLLELVGQGREFVTLQELAVPFSKHVCDHISKADKQGTFSGSTKFLESCRGYVNGQSTHEELIDSTTRLGFNNVIDAFHNVGDGEIGKRFYEDERRSTNKGIRLRQEAFELLSGDHAESLPAEIEARWRLVETAWGLQVPVSAIEVQYDLEAEELQIQDRNRRKSITGCRDALNGYQKGACFYCGTTISVISGSTLLADVDHLIPHCLKNHLAPKNLNGVWNLVLACKHCNRGQGGKSDSLPDIRFAIQLHIRNEYYITSHHPLRETIINQTGKTREDRRRFLDDVWNDAHSLRATPRFWVPADRRHEGI